MFKLHVEDLPLEDASEEDKAKAFGSFGYVGVKLYQVAFSDLGRDLSLD